MSTASRNEINWMDDAEKYEILAQMISRLVLNESHFMGPMLSEIHYTQDTLLKIWQYATEVSQVGK
jgi:hypothetical protein